MLASPAGGDAIDIQTPLSAAELATLEAVDGPYGYRTEPTDATARLVALGFVKAMTRSLYVTRAGRLRLLTERSLAKCGYRAEEG